MPLSRPLTIIIACAVALRLLGLFVAHNAVGPDAFIYGDAIGYVELAQHIAHGEAFTSAIEGQQETDLFRTPGLPLILAPFVLIPNGLLWYAIVLSILGGVLLPLLTYKIGEMLFGERPGIIASALVAFEPHLIFFSWLPLTEIPFIVCLLGGGFLLLQQWNKKSNFTFMLGALLVGYAALIRPGFWPVLCAITIGACLYAIVQKRKVAARWALVLLFASLAVVPWMARTYSYSGVFTLSGAGWRNVYTDYLASARALDKKTSFSEEKTHLKDVDAKTLGLSRANINNPRYTPILRDYALAELWQRKETVVKMEVYLLASYFTHDGYYYAFDRFGFINGEAGEAHSVSFALLSQGLTGVPTIFFELKRQYFLPLLGRLFTVGIALLALFGAWKARLNPATYLLVATIALFALTATAIGLGVESRLRLPMEPLLFMLAGVALSQVYSWYENRYLHSRV